MNVSTLFPSQCLLGESPLWHRQSRSCFWVDIQKSILYQYDWLSAKTKQWEIKEHVSLAVEGPDDNLIIAVKGGILKFNLKTANKTWLADIDKNISNNRCNDGGCDIQGRLWVGAMDMECKENAGSLYRVDNNLVVNKMVGNRTIPNGLTWSLHNERMYFIDTPSQTVVSYLYNKNSGDIYYEKIAVNIPVNMGMPDGMAIDAEGMLWIALYNGGCITRWNPSSGELLDEIDLPAIHITNCAFVGDDLGSLIVTSARENLSVEQLNEYPESGNVFLIKGFPVKGKHINKASLNFN
ncbi:MULTISPECIES: SMP-30/gluconolactonase/LRE family protein [unclassified Mucilaginibacter]|uniref:SMP-30/gluconolactonase/LRE family protein n=1 Tax=unclassified Mucilaginibacter TaxID=2617802 RepID=UPI002AC9D5A5|nr:MULTISPECIES: SMP-30/gluconolactonase/LRE family protein [unclassified Mucilaginibacter]MEB0261961.1 SMP-30/gluconolactonase/LRE family protein [Mucilaginibacter sp. 10I4]MEB0277261.1 SMP-30/gluconolactonase/LRE family protein [Mucilaginibacter sp. 10B2]MEB0300875.1 SMP-30/gluconolactonase/LRE family protein [Mucilaginibacter sp. 5C4]WPX25388.1 SMP-30/gluconolactonase/LRE family protein [Mucilaginibacter sp. 5C4]